MAFDAFVKIDGIEGESTDNKHAGWIEVLEYGTKISQKVSATASSAGGAGVERADFAGFTFRKQLDKASPKIAVTCADGTHVDTVIVEFCRAGTDKTKFMEYRLTNCIVSDVSTMGGGEFPSEAVSINYGKIEWRYTQQKRQGGRPAGNVAAGWNLEKNYKV